MRTLAMPVAVVLLMLSQAAIAADSGQSHKKEESKGLTVDDLGRGLKSAGQNIEKEIPKIGPAIGDTVKKIAGGASENKKGESHSKAKK